MDNPACTHLNLCAVLSQLNNHEAALNHAICALKLLQREVASDRPVAGANDLGTLAIAFHNLAVEQEFLHRLEDAVHSYERACQVAETSLGADHSMTLALKRSLQNARKALLRRPPLKTPSHKVKRRPQSVTRTRPQSALATSQHTVVQSVRALSRPVSAALTRYPGTERSTASGSGEQTPLTMSISRHSGAGGGSGAFVSPVAASTPQPKASPYLFSREQSSHQSSTSDMSEYGQQRRPQSSSSQQQRRPPSAQPSRGRQMSASASGTREHLAGAVHMFPPSRGVSPTREMSYIRRESLSSAARSPSPEQQQRATWGSHFSRRGRERNQHHDPLYTNESHPYSQVQLPSENEFTSTTFTGSNSSVATIRTQPQQQQQHTSLLLQSPEVDSVPELIIPRVLIPPPSVVSLLHAQHPGTQQTHLPLSPLFGGISPRLDMSTRPRSARYNTDTPTIIKMGPEPTHVLAKMLSVADTPAPTAPIPTAVSPEVSLFPSAARRNVPRFTSSPGFLDSAASNSSMVSSRSGKSGGSRQSMRSSPSRASITRSSLRMPNEASLFARTRKASDSDISTESMERFVDVDSSQLFSKTDGKVYVWGANDHGQLGLGHTDNDKSTMLPQQLLALAEKSIMHVACGSEHVLVLSTDGCVYAWGSNTYGQLGLGHTFDALGPEPVPTLCDGSVGFIACGTEHTLFAHAIEGMLSCGRNDYRQLGLRNETSDMVSTPTDIHVLATLRVISAAAGERHSVISVSDGGVFTWGSGDDGRLGHNDTTDRPEPSRVLALDGRNNIHVAAGVDHTVSVTVNGDVFAWGADKMGQLGFGEGLRHMSNYMQVAPRLLTSLKLKTAVEVACGYGHGLCRTDTSAVYGWGLGSSGQLGIGGITNADVPELIGAFVDMGKDCTQIACGLCHSAAIFGGDLYMWGWGKDGRLGIGSQKDALTPVHVTSGLRGKTIRSVACGAEFTVIITGPSRPAARRRRTLADAPQLSLSLSKLVANV
eukprot:TRINITY_DN11641_c0_g1_i1.p1 TRINITY_DN11641_c0_g1~~TRINITY_DN11641_c0_g1_i1.p1  ORF type:complete len:1160 (+),score=184.22 TRINITY_DN11641_c0_g1_i1:499-3480(+)